LFGVDDNLSLDWTSHQSGQTWWLSSGVPASVAALQLKPKPSRHRFEKPIHNVKKLAARMSRDTAARAADLGASSSG
jgi:hypothetical protein